MPCTVGFAVLDAAVPVVHAQHPDWLTVEQTHRMVTEAFNAWSLALKARGLAVSFTERPPLSPSEVVYEVTPDGSASALLGMPTRTDVQMMVGWVSGVQETADASGFPWVPELTDRIGGIGGVLARDGEFLGSMAFINTDRVLRHSYEVARSVVMHEVGHMLNLRHSDDPHDMMFAQMPLPFELTDTDVDRAAVEFAHCVPMASPTVTVVGELLRWRYDPSYPLPTTRNPDHRGACVRERVTSWSDGQVTVTPLRLRVKCPRR